MHLNPDHVSADSALATTIEWLRRHYYYAVEESIVWSTLQTIGLLMGHDIKWRTDGQPLSATLSLLHIAETGGNKSRVLGEQKRLIREIAPFDADTGRGVRSLPKPASGESFIEMLRHEVGDHEAPEAPKRQVPTVNFQVWPEIATLMAKADIQGSTLTTTLIDLYDELDDISTASKKGGIHRCDEVNLVALSSTTQPDSVHGLFTVNHTRNGFLNRIVPVYGEPKAVRDLSRDLDDEVPLLRARAVEELRKLYAWCREHPQVLTMTPDAEGEWKVWMMRLGLYETKNPLFTRIETTCMRIATILSVNEAYRAGKPLAGRIWIEPRHIELAFSVFGSNMLASYTRFGDDLAVTREQEMSNEIVQWTISYAQSKGEWPTPSDIKNQRFWKNAPKRTREDAERIALDDGRLLKIKVHRDGSKPTRYVAPRDATETAWAENYRDSTMTLEASLLHHNIPPRRAS